MEQGSYLIIERGMTVHGTDGTLGTVAEVIADVSTDVFRGIVLAHGLLLPKHTFLSGEHITSVNASGVQVNLSKQDAENLPPSIAAGTPTHQGEERRQ